MTVTSSLAESAFGELCDRIDELDTLASIDGLLGWDQQVTMGPGAAIGRGAQRALLGRMLHARATDPRIASLLDTLEPMELDPVQRRAVRHMRKEHDRSSRVSAELAEDIARASSEGLAAWSQAKQARDFAQFAPSLARNLDLARRRCDAIDANRHPYDVMLDDYDPGTTIESLRPMFARLRAGLTRLLEAIVADGCPSAAPFAVPLDTDAQLRLHREVLDAIGYDQGRGALGLAAHPFSVRVGASDVRVATRVIENDILGGLAATLHEGGHALYEQGLPAGAGKGGSAVFAACSTGVHESQSRLWENVIGRGLPFYHWLGPILERHLPVGTGGLDPEALYRASNRVVPGVVRVSADEVTYNLHVILRFELEVEMFEGTLAVSEVPSAWRERMQQYLGVAPEHDADGALQDAHWSGGAFGYFPSYTLGNLYAASIYAELRRVHPDCDSHWTRGDFAPTLSWLRAQVHDHGRMMDAPALMHEAVGARDHVADLLNYLADRHGAIHGLSDIPLFG